MATNGPVRVGFLGAGLIATFHSKLLRPAALTNGVEIARAGVFDPDRERADRFAAASGCPVLGSEDEVIERSDAVYVCTWTSDHHRLVAAAASAGRHVFCEKPLAFDARTARAIVRDVGLAGVTNQVGLVLRRSPAYLVAADLVRDPAAGPVFAAVLRDDQYFPTQGRYDSRWRADRRLAGRGTLLEHSIHDLDLLRTIVGELATVSAFEATRHDHDGIEDVVTTSLRFENGALGTLTSVWHDNLARPSLRRLEVICRHRIVVVDGDDWWGPVTWTDSDGATGSLGGTGRREREALAAAAARLLPDGATTNADADFVRAAAAGAPAWPDFAVAIEAHRLVDAIYRSADQGGTPVDLGPGAGWQVVEIDAEQTHPLRRTVLRDGTASSEVRFDDDEREDTTHLGLIDASGALAAVSTWIERRHPDHPGRPGVQLRGMAVEPTLQGAGLGDALLRAGVRRAIAGGVDVVWARARDSALDFYLERGFRRHGHGYVDLATGLPHHDVVLDVAASV